MGSCLCKEKKSKSSRAAGHGDDNSNNRGSSGYQTQSNDRRRRAVERSLGRSPSETTHEDDTYRCDRNITLGVASEDNNVVTVSSIHPVTRLSSQST